MGLLRLPHLSARRERGAEQFAGGRREYKITVIPLLRVEDVSRKLEDTVMLSFPSTQKLQIRSSSANVQICILIAWNSRGISQHPMRKSAIMSSLASYLKMINLLLDSLDQNQLTNFSMRRVWLAITLNIANLQPEGWWRHRLDSQPFPYPLAPW